LPTENYAIKHKIKPAVATEENVKNFKKQMRSLGLSFDWDREVNTTDPEYYRWTQWIFLQFYKHAMVDDKIVKVADNDVTTPRLAFQAEMPVNWCPSCKVVLANEEVIGGDCERCGTQTQKRKQKQWMLRITAYADRLIKDLDTVDYLEKIKTQQINWIGKSVGAEVDFPVKDTKEIIKVFTTRPDTLFGVTYMAVAPEHDLIKKLGSKISNLKDVNAYIEQAKSKSDLERTELQKEKTGVELKGVKAINPINNEEIPIFVADYVLSTYGTGAVMAVPAHDERDWEFAKKYNLPIKQVITPVFGDRHGNEEPRRTISAVIRRKRDGKFLMLYWPKQKYFVPVIGGIEGDESFEETVLREVMEETGYNVNIIEPIGGIVESHFFAEHKNVWRQRFNQCFLCELEDETQAAIPEDEPEHDILWLTEKEVLEKITFPDSKLCFEMAFRKNHAYVDGGILVNSNQFTSLPNKDAKEKITKWLEEHKLGKKAVNFKLRDWIFSRQHYWGEPIPIVHCEKCGAVPIPEDKLPVTLPDVENYQPTDTGESPLAKITDWVNTKCPNCGGSAKRETDTMPNWAGSSWYFLRYCDPRNDKNLAAEDKLKYWTPVDLYNGGMEHTTLHLLYSRFWHKFLYDLGVVPTSEPYAKRIAHGIILGPDGRKMSKSFGNVINPDDIAKEYGADTLRAYIMFIGPYDQESAWSRAGVAGVFRFLKRVWSNNDKVKGDSVDKRELLVKLNQTIAGITDDLESFHLNTYIAKLMEFNNLIERVGEISVESYKKFLVLLFPAAPHITSEVWGQLGYEGTIEQQDWPKADERYLVAEKTEIVVQINGKVRDKILVDSDISDKQMEEVAMASEKITSMIQGKKVTKVIVIPKKLVSVVTE
jgi:leucyl-tRNA synthetase